MFVVVLLCLSDVILCAHSNKSVRTCRNVHIVGCVWGESALLCTHTVLHNPIFVMCWEETAGFISPESCLSHSAAFLDWQHRGQGLARLQDHFLSLCWICWNLARDCDFSGLNQRIISIHFIYSFPQCESCSEPLLTLLAHVLGSWLHSG